MFEISKGRKMAVPNSWSGALKIFNYLQRARPTFSYFCLNGAEKQFLLPRLCIGQCVNMYAGDVKAETAAMSDGPGLNPKKKKKEFIPRVTLLTESDEISVVTLEMANKIAARRNLKLVKIVDFDTKTERPTYKLMTTKDFIQGGLMRKKEKKLEQEMSLKPEKMLSVSTKINEHDLQTKLKSIFKFLSKKHEVRFVIAFDGNEEKAAEICTQLETVLKDLSLTIKKARSNDKMRIHLRPNLEEKIPENTEAKETKDEIPVAPGS